MYESSLFNALFINDLVAGSYTVHNPKDVALLLLSLNRQYSVVS